MNDRQSFPVVITGSNSFTEATRVEATLARPLSRRRMTHAVVLVCGPETPGRIAARWGEANGLAVEHHPDADPRDRGAFRIARLF
jgi:hypothetical protein